MPDVDLTQFKTLYNQTALDYLHKIEEGIHSIKQNPSDKNSINAVHIAAHSLKSQSYLMGYSSVGNASMVLEKTFRVLNDSTGPVSNEIIQAVEIVVHAVHAAISNITDGHPEGVLSKIIERFRTTISLGE